MMVGCGVRADQSGQRRGQNQVVMVAFSPVLVGVVAGCEC